MSTVVTSFNTLLVQFVEELCRSFPEEPKLGLVAGQIEELARVNARKPLELFVGALQPHSALVQAKDPSLFSAVTLPAGLDLAALWAKDDVPDETRTAIWSYVQMLFMLGTTVIQMPAELLAMVESFALKLAGGAGEAGSGAPGLPDMGALMGGMSSMLTGLMGSGGGGSGNDLSGVLGQVASCLTMQMGGVSELTGPAMVPAEPASRRAGQRRSKPSGKPSGSRKPSGTGKPSGASKSSGRKTQAPDP